MFLRIMRLWNGFPTQRTSLVSLFRAKTSPSPHITSQVSDPTAPSSPPLSLPEICVVSPPPTSLPISPPNLPFLNTSLTPLPHPNLANSVKLGKVWRSSFQSQLLFYRPFPTHRWTGRVGFPPPFFLKILLHECCGRVSSVKVYHALLFP